MWLQGGLIYVLLFLTVATGTVKLQEPMIRRRQSNYRDYEYYTEEPIRLRRNSLRNRLQTAVVELSGPVLGVPGILPQPASSELFIQDDIGK